MDFILPCNLVLCYRQVMVLVRGTNHHRLDDSTGLLNVMCNEFVEVQCQALKFIHLK